MTSRRADMNYLVRHHVAQKHHMSRVNAHPMRLHCELDLIYDGAPRSFNAQDLRCLYDMVRRGELSNNA